VTLARGDTLELRMPGGGGVGDPAGRDPALLAADVEAGLVGADAARTLYRPTSSER
jgi:N-methylhydantoinase B